MQIMIEVDDDLYTRLFDNGVDNYDDAVDMAKAIRKGKVLPEVKVITRGNCMICGKELTEGLFFCKECGDKANSRK